MEAKNYLKADFLDILFEGKNKEYGAYTLRKQYDRRVAKAVIITICLLLLCVGAIAFTKYMKANSPVEDTPIQKDVVLQQVNVEKPDLPPPPPPPPAPEPPKLKTQVKYTPPKVVEDKMVPPDAEPPDMSQLKDVAISTVNKAGDPNGIDPGLVQQSGNGVTQAAPPANKVFQFVEQMPSFPGGQQALMEYLRDHVRYPAIARENGIQGTVVVQFVVNTDGSIVEVRTVGAKKGGGLEDEALRVVKSMPKWTPGKQNGRSVRVQFSLPIRFKLR